MNKLIKKIMIALDFSDYTETSVEYGIALAGQLEATLLLVNVVNNRDLMAVEKYLAVSEPELYQKFVDDTYAARHESMQKLLSKAADQGVDGQKLVKTGVPYQELLSAIESEKPDLLIMGTKGRSNLTDTIIGSCAQKMYRRSPIPLLSIRPPQK
ncbi:MAG: universal stress protein [Desulfosarcinaceae bacterium]